MTTKLKWRLKEPFSPADVVHLVEKDLITKEEAKQLLFNETDEAPPTDFENLAAEVKLLREMVLSLASAKSPVMVVDKYKQYPFYSPYQVWYNSCVSGSGAISNTTGTTNHLLNVSNSNFDRVLSASNQVSYK